MTTNVLLKGLGNLNVLIREVSLYTHQGNVARKSGDDGEKTTNHLKCVNVIVSWDDGIHTIAPGVITGRN